MSDTQAPVAQPASVHVLDSAKSGAVTAVGKNSIQELPTIVNDPNGTGKVESTLAWKRAQRLAQIKEELAGAAEQEVQERVRTGNSKRGVEAEVSDDDAANTQRASEARDQDGDVNHGNDELELGAEIADLQQHEGEETAEAKEPEQTEEQRKEARRKEVETREVSKAKEPDTEEAAEAAPEAEAKPQTDTSKLDKERREKFEKVLAMEAKAQKQADKVRQREQDVARKEREFEQKAQTFQREWQQRAQQYDRDIKTAQQILALAKDSPLELLERAGAKPEDVAKWIADASDPVNKKLREMDARFAELQARERRLAQEEQQRAQQAEMQRKQAEVESNYLNHFEEKDGDDYVFEAARTIYSRAELIRLGNEIAQEATERGERNFTYRDLAEAINEAAKEDSRYKALVTKYNKQKPVETTVQAKASPAPSPAPKVAAPVAKPTGVAITNSAVQDSAPKKSAPVRNWKENRRDRVKKLLNGI